MEILCPYLLSMRVPATLLYSTNPEIPMPTPARYRAIKRDCLKEGNPLQSCKSKAAAIDNSLRAKEGKPPMQTKRKPSPR